MEGSGDGIKRRESNEGGGMIGSVERQRDREGGREMVEHRR